MMSFTLKTALLCTFSWISVSASEFRTVEVQPGGEVTLLCANFSSVPIHILWFKLASRPNISCISSMWNSDGDASFYDEFQNGKFKMTSNTTTVFLKIKQVDLSDSGLYFCGFYLDRMSTIVSATYLKVQDESDEIPSLTSVILGALVIFLVIVVLVLVVKIRKLHIAHKERQKPIHSENPDSEALNYAALRFQPKARSSRRPAEENQLETHVVYAAPRSTPGNIWNSSSEWN